MSNIEMWFEVRDDRSARQLIDLLEPAAARLKAFEFEPALVAEAPHKFNDAGYDDYWCAAQFGASFWEQSQFFEHTEHQRITENATFVPDQTLSPDATGTAVSSGRIQSLRALLRELQSGNWRETAAKALNWSWNLQSLAIEYGQPWLCLEHVNDGEGVIISWDNEGFFPVGSIERLDQAIGRSQVLLFETLIRQNLHRLGAQAQAYFMPQVRDAVALARLHAQLLEAIGMVRSTADHAVALKAGGSRNSAADLERRPMQLSPESFSDGLLSGEGQYRVAHDGVWPKLRSYYQRPMVETELSDLAKTCNLALRGLHDGGWRGGFAQALGEPLTRGETVALFVDADQAVLTRDNSYFSITDSGIGFAGALDYPMCSNPARTLEIYAAHQER